MSMTKNKADKMLTEINELLASKYPDFSVKLSTRCYMTDGRISFKATLTDSEGGMSIAKAELERGMFKNGLDPRIIGFEFSTDNNTYIVESVKTRRQKYPVVAREVRTGKLYKFQASMINTKFNAKRKAKYNA